MNINMRSIVLPVLIFIFTSSAHGFSDGKLLPSEKQAPGIVGLLIQNAVSQVNALAMTPAATCTICFDKKPQPSFITLQCSHKFCRGCLSEMIDISSKDKNIRTAICPTCKVSLDIQDVTTIFNSNNDTVKKFEALATKTAIAQMPGMRQCPTPNCSQVFENETNLTHTMICLECSKQYCANCLIDHPPAKTCGQAKKELDEKNEEWLKTNTKPCPKCHVNIEKNMGCNHMTCKKCKHEFYWCCLAAFDKGRSLNHVCAKKPVQPPQPVRPAAPLPHYDQPAPSRPPVQNSHHARMAQAAAPSTPQPQTPTQPAQPNVTQEYQVAELYREARLHERRKAMSADGIKRFRRHMRLHKKGDLLNEVRYAHHVIECLPDFEAADRIRVRERIPGRLKAMPDAHKRYLEKMESTYIKSNKPTQTQIAQCYVMLLRLYDEKVKEASVIYEKNKLPKRMAELNDHQSRTLTRARDSLTDIDPVKEAEYLVELVTQLEEDKASPKQTAVLMYEQARYDERRDALAFTEQSELKRFEVGEHARSLTPVSQAHFLIGRLNEIENSNLSVQEK